MLKNRYLVRIASSSEEIRDAMKLRYEVFNLEMHEGLEASHISGIDEDEFDSFCEHLVILERVSGAVIGTYRMQTGKMAKKNIGFYSAREFDFHPFIPLQFSIVELGRACVHRDHRSIMVITLLWKAILHYVQKHNARYIIGCSSISSIDPALGHTMYQKFSQEGSLAEPRFLTKPLANFLLPYSNPLPVCPPPPKLLRSYLSMGAKICGEPAIDREFGTIDFLTLLDCHQGAFSVVECFLKRHHQP